MIAERPPKRRKVSVVDDALPGFTRWNLEEAYETRSRKNRKQDVHQRLPFKTAKGQLIAQVDSTTHDLVDDDSEFASEVDSAIANVEEPKLKPLRKQLSRREQIISAKEELARIAESVSGSPEENVGLLQRLLDITSSDDLVIRKLALGTQLAVYKDIIPGYRIRPMSRDELQGKISKDIKALRAFEQGLLSAYTAYVKLLSDFGQLKRVGETDDDSLSTLATACICELLQSVPHFNLRNDLIDSLVRQLSKAILTGSSSSDRIIACIENVFREDDDGHISLEIVTRLGNMMKEKGYHVHESVLNTFLHLRLLNEFQGKASTERVNIPEEPSDVRLVSKKKRDFRTKRERKQLRELKAVEKEMKEADAAVSHEERDRFQGDTLKIVFVTYFRILKARIPALTGAVLEGLARYAHLINQDFFGDVLEVLRELIVELSSQAQINDDDEDGDDDVTGGGDGGGDRSLARNTLRQSLLCATTAFAMLHGQVDVMKSAAQLQLDLNFFTTHVYRSLGALALDADIELSGKSAHLQDPNGLTTSAIDTKVNVATTTVLLLRSLQATLLPASNRRSVPPARSAAFAKKLLTTALQLPAKSTLAILGLVTSMIKANGVRMGSLWNTDERKGDGVYNWLSEEPEAANPFAATAWEGEVLKLHFDPRIREAQKLLQRSVREAVK